MNLSNGEKLNLAKQIINFLNSTVTFEDETTAESGTTAPVDEVTGATAPTETYTIELDGEETILNIYEDGTTEPALADGKYAFKEDENKLIIIEDGLFKGLEEIEQPEPSADPIEENLPVVQEDEEKKEEEEPTEEETKEEETTTIDEAKGLWDKIAELEAKIEELNKQIEGKDKEIETLRKQPTTQKVDTPKVETGDKYTKLVQALNKK